MKHPSIATSPLSSTSISRIAAGALVALTTLSSPSLHAIGFRNASQDSLAVARGDAFVATADNPSAVYYNPAAITELRGTQVSGGSYLVTARTRYEAPDGETTRNESEIHALPHFYATYNLPSSPWAFGLGLVAPFGLATEWPDDVRFRNVAIEGSITYVSLMPAVAYKINRQLSIGGGPTLNYVDAELIQGTFPGEHSRFTGDDSSAGYHLGIRWQPNQKHVFGANYRSHDNLNLDGTSNVQPSPPLPGRERGTGNLTVPDYVVVGYSYRPTREWNFEVNIDWTNWDRLNTMTLRTDSFEQDIPFNWKSSFMYQVGATRYLRNGYRVSGGYIFSENSVPDEDFSPLVPDADRHLVTAGFGRSYNRLSWDFAAQIGHSPTRTVPETESPADGKYDTNVFAGSFTVAFNF